MRCYRVTKKINGRFYDYWQRTYRVGRTVKTENKYIGPASFSSRCSPVGSSLNSTRAALSPEISLDAPRTPEDAIWSLNPYHNPDNVDLRQYKKSIDKERREDERIQYGPLRARLKRQRQKFLEAKRKTRGIKALNPFIAQALLSRRGQ